jgi:PPOX class probable F420-dependent enzyme
VAADGGTFAPLASAKHLLLITVTRDGTQVCTSVGARIAGDRAYFRTSSASPAAKRLQRTAWVQVAPCTALGFVRYGPTVDATARLLAGEEADRAAGGLARAHPAWRELLSSLIRRVTGRRTVYYELRADPEEPAPPAGTAPAPKRAAVRLVPADGGQRGRSPGAVRGGPRAGR